MQSFRQSQFFLFLLGSIVCTKLNGQGKINVPSTECLGNLTSFTYTPSSGLTLSAASWDFGDGNNSSNLTPLHTYASIGFYTIKINATFTNASTRTDSIKIEVVGLPKANFFMLPKSDSCLSKNILKYQDTSSPAKSGQSITSRLMVWGDGDFETSNSPKKGDFLTHTYLVAAKFTLKMEVTDKFGCKGSMTKIVGILDDIDADAYLDTSWANCTTAKLCVRNTSKGNNVKSGSFQWVIDNAAIDTNGYFAFPAQKCVTFNNSRTVKVVLIAIAKSGCRDTFTEERKLIADTLHTTMELSDTIVCRSSDDLIMASVKRSVWDTIYWKIDGIYITYAKGTEFYFLPKSSLLPGKHVVTAQIVRGACSVMVNRGFTVNGPVADFRIFDNHQCSSNRPLFFTDQSTYINRKNVTYLWTVFDTLGEKCICNRIKNINRYKNCNQSVDWYTKHQFSKTSTDYKVRMEIKDTVTGCMDFSEQTVYFNDCPPILKYDSVVLCQNEIFMVVSPAFPENVTTDSGKTWKKFPLSLDTTYNGWYNMGFAFKTIQSPWAENFGSDSIKIHKDTITFYDTSYKNKFLKVNPLKKDQFSLKIYGQCKPYRAVLYLKSGKFLKGERLRVNWSSGIPIDITFQRDTVIDSVTHAFKSVGLQSFVRIYITNKEGCEWKTTIDYAFGKNFSVYIPKVNLLCTKKTVCFTAMVYEFDTKYYWTNDQSMHNRKISWKFDDTASPTNLFHPCHTFIKGGKQAYKMMLVDSLGCKDTLVDTLYIQQVKANMKYLSKIVYCAELKQFFDSSTYLYKNIPPLDTIKNYAWKFGNGVYSSLVKNPLQVINTSLDSIQVMHAVEMLSGCVDTIALNIKVIGPHPYFIIKDTIGCGSLQAIFINQSRNCKSYLWEFGDSLKSTLQTGTKQIEKFTYNKPGRYYIYLTGYDTVTNPLSGKTFYCKNTFPDKLFQKDTTRSVLVLPYRTTGIQSKDTICLGSALVLKSLSEPGYDFDYWQMGDSTTYTLATGSSVSHLYKKEGQFKVKLNPGYTDSLQNKLCRDSAQKDILVVGVKADFTIDPIVIPPLFQFYNKSAPTGALLRWDFGQSGSGSNNSSTDQNPSHHYGNDTGTYNVCLIASIPQGCSDTICKTVYNDHLTELKLFNVFTPGSLDGKNDQYDILIEGEALYDLKIYNRWGILVFEGDKDGDQTNQDNWNGKVLNKGAECPSGTYYYIFRYSLRTEPDNIKTITGVITLIR